MAKIPRKDYKIILLGDTNVGKSAIVLRFVKNQYLFRPSSTIGVSFLYETIFIADTFVRLEIWDTAGQEKYQSLLPMYYRRAEAAIIVYDINCLLSFNRAKLWIELLKEKDLTNIVIALVGNKCDVSGRVVNYEEAEEYANTNGFLFMETSAKANINITAIFTALAKKLMIIENLKEENNLKLLDKRKLRNCCR